MSPFWRLLAIGVVVGLMVFSGYGALLGWRARNDRRERQVLGWGAWDDTFLGICTMSCVVTIVVLLGLLGVW